MNRQIRLRPVRRPETGAGDVRQHGVVGGRHSAESCQRSERRRHCPEDCCRCCKARYPFSDSSSNRRCQPRNLVLRLVSIAYWSTAESIIRRSLRIRLAWERLRARRNPGTAIAAKSAMIATTIMISTRVKPPRRLLSLFNIAICFLFFIVCLFDCAPKHPPRNNRFNEHSRCQAGDRFRISRKWAASFWSLDTRFRRDSRCANTTAAATCRLIRHRDFA